MEHGLLPPWFTGDTGSLPTLNRKEPDELLYDVPFEDYLSDLSCISSSGLKIFLQSPYHFLSAIMKRFKGDEDEDKDCFRFGRAAHMMILEPAKFRELFLLEPVHAGKTKDGRDSAQSAEARANKELWWSKVPKNAVVMNEEEMQDLTYMVQSLMYHNQIKNILKNGRAEVTGKFVDKDTGIRIRIRPDYLTIDKDDCLYISDLKTTRDASRRPFRRQSEDYKYYLQAALYADGIQQITGKQIHAVALIAMEKKPPYTVANYWMDEDDLDIGRREYKHALMFLKKSLVEGKWPSFQQDGEVLKLTGLQYLELPQFDYGEET